MVPREQQDGDSVRQLTGRLVEGEDAAFHEFVSLYGGRLLRLAVSLMAGKPGAAEDIYQETLLRVVKKPRIFETEGALWNWLAKITRNLVIDLHRMEASRARALQNIPAPAGASNGNPETLLLEALERMAAEESTLLRAKYMEGQTSRELALALGITESAVDSRMARARAVLRGILQGLAVGRNEP